MKEFINQLVEKARNWAIVASTKQWYIAVMAVLFVLWDHRDQQTIGVVLALLFMAMVAWWAFVKFGFVKSSKQE